MTYVAPGERGGGGLWRPLVGAMLSQVVLGTVRPTISYAALEHGADAFLVGLVTASFAVVPMLVALPVGALAGRLRRIAVVPLVSALVLVVGALLAAEGSGLTTLVIGSVLLGTGNLGVLLGCQTWIARSTRSADYSASFGWLTAGMAAGQAIGPVLAGISIGTTRVSVEGITASFLLAASCSATIAAIFLSSASRGYSASGAADRVRPLQMMRSPTIMRYVVLSAAVLTVVDLITAYLPVVGSQRGIAPAVVGAMLAVRGFTSTLSRVFLGALSRRFTDSTLIATSAFGAAGSLLMMALIPDTVVLFVVLGLGGFFIGMGQPLTMTAVAVLLPARDRSSGLAFRLVGNRFAQTALPVLAGSVAGSLGVTALFVVQSALLVVCGGWELVRRHDARGLP